MRRRLPDARRPTSIDDGVEDRGLGRLLCDVAVEAGKVDDLRARLEARAGQPLGELPAQVLLATLAVQAKDDARAIEAFKALGERHPEGLAAGAPTTASPPSLLPALADPKFADARRPVHREGGRELRDRRTTPQQAVELRFKLAELPPRHARTRRRPGRSSRWSRRSARRSAAASTTSTCRWPRQYLKAGWVDDALRELGLHADQHDRGRRPTREPRPAGPSRRSTSSRGWSGCCSTCRPPSGTRRSRRGRCRPRAASRSGTTSASRRSTSRRRSSASCRRCPPNQVVSTMLLLADAAKEAGKVDELAAEADKLAADKVENAELFQVLVVPGAGQGQGDRAGGEGVRRGGPQADDRPSRSGRSARGTTTTTTATAADAVPPERVPVRDAVPRRPGAGRARRGAARADARPRRRARSNRDYLHRIRAAWDRLGGDPGRRARRARRRRSRRGGTPPPPRSRLVRPGRLPRPGVERPAVVPAARHAAGRHVRVLRRRLPGALRPRGTSGTAAWCSSRTAAASRRRSGRSAGTTRSTGRPTASATSSSTGSPFRCRRARSACLRQRPALLRGHRPAADQPVADARTPAPGAGRCSATSSCPASRRCRPR